MFSNAGAVHGVKLKSRCLAAQEADEDRHRFFIGSSCLREENEILLVEFNEELVDSVCSLHTYSHPKEMVCLAPSPINASLFFTCAGDGETCLWNAPNANQSMDQRDEGKAGITPLDKITSLPQKDSKYLKALWQPRTFGSEKVAAFNKSVEIYDVNAESAKEVTSFKCEGEAVMGCAWDPHNSTQLATTQGVHTLGWDIRSAKQTYSISSHKYCSRDVDFNPNKPQHVVTCGDDRLIKLWDLRSCDKPIRTLAGHSHWCSTVKYNRFHDQLLLSGGTDSLVNLWRVSSVSSAPLLELDDTLDDGSSGGGGGSDSDSDEGFGQMTLGSSNQHNFNHRKQVSKEKIKKQPSDAVDCIVRSYEDHEESVYSVAWSSCDAWVFASLDFSGRLCVNHVPSTEKYKILL